jgi:acetolactate synthase-1/2/3 large subunit
MAAVEGELLDRPGVCLLAQGPGAAAAVAGVAHAFLDRSPLLVLADRGSRTSLRLGSRHGLDQAGIFEEVTKETVTLSAARAERVLRRAWERAWALAGAWASV